MDLTNIRALVQADLTQTDQLISECLRSEIQLIPQLGQHLIHSGGKRLRPLLVLLSAHAFGYQGKAHIELAATIELIHTATLLHDDVVDSSDLRRGQRTANAIWGNAASILVGDFLYSRAFQTMVKINDLNVMRVLANATNTIAEGEILQLLNCNNPHATEAEYMNIIRAKTGTLFGTATQMGPVLCQQSDSIVQAMMHYGMHLGTAFQLVDDALDYSTSTEILGKKQGDDLAEGKPTLPLIYALLHGTDTQKQTIKEAIETADRNRLEIILAAIESTGAITYTYKLAQEHVTQAIQYLQNIPDSKYRQALIQIAQFTVQRDH